MTLPRWMATARLLEPPSDAPVMWPQRPPYEEGWQRKTGFGRLPTVLLVSQPTTSTAPGGRSGVVANPATTDTPPLEGTGS